MLCFDCKQYAVRAEKVIDFFTIENAHQGKTGMTGSKLVWLIQFFGWSADQRKYRPRTASPFSSPFFWEDRRRLCLQSTSPNVIQLTLTLKMTTKQVVETSVTSLTTITDRNTFNRTIQFNLLLIMILIMMKSLSKISYWNHVGNNKIRHLTPPPPSLHYGREKKIL